MGGRSLLVALLLSNIFWLLVFVSYTQHDAAPFSAAPSATEAHLCPPCSCSSEAIPSQQRDDPAGTGKGSLSQEPQWKSDDDSQSCDTTLRGDGTPHRVAQSWGESWYNNGLLELPSAVGLRRLRSPGGEQFPHFRDTDVCEGAESDVWAYGFDAPGAAEVGILWPRDSRYRLLVLQQSLLGMAVRNAAGEEVATVVEVLQSEEWDGNVNLLLHFAASTAAGCDALIGVVEQPFPSWVLEFSFGFTAALDPLSKDSTKQQLVDVAVTLRRQRIHDYNFVHMFNPYTPRHQEMELTVVQRSLEVAYNRAWEQGIRVLILATTFKEDLAMVHYPYQPASRSLTRHFLDPMGRKIPLMDDMLDLMWEDGATQDTYIFTNADIAVIPDFYMDCWTIYRSDTAVPVLLREQLPLEAIDLTHMQHLYDATANDGVKHTGDDCFLFPASLLPSIDYGMVFPAYPPFACFLMQLLGEREGGRYRLRSRSTFHLGVDTETSVWLNDPDTVVGRHVNNLNAIATLESHEHEETLETFVDKCRIRVWQMDRPQMQTQIRLQLYGVPQLLPSGVPSWFVGTAFPASAYGRVAYDRSKAATDANRADTNIFSDEIFDIMGQAFRNFATAAQHRFPGGVGAPLQLPELVGDAPWPLQGLEVMTAEERVKEIRQMSNERLWNSLPRDNQVIDEWMAQLGIPLPQPPERLPYVGPAHSGAQVIGQSVEAQVESLLAQAQGGLPLRLVECVTPGMTGIPFLFDLLVQVEGVGGARELEPKMIGQHLSQVLTAPLEHSRAGRAAAKLPPLLSRWLQEEQRVFLDMNNMFIKTYADVVLESPLVAVCREQVAAGRAPAVLVDVVVLRRPFLELVWKQVQRGWFNARSNTNQRGVWYYSLGDVVEPSFRVLPPLVTLPATASSIAEELHLIVGYNLDIEERSRRFVAAHEEDPCVRVHEVRLADLATTAGAVALLRELGVAAPPAHWNVEASFRRFLDEEAEQGTFRVSRATVEEEVAAFYRAYIDEGLVLPMVDLAWT